MQYKYNFCAVNFIFQDIQQSEALFDDILTILNENFVQTLFIVQREN